MKKVVVIAFAVMIMFSIIAVGALVVSAESEHVVEQEMTFAMGNSERTGLYSGPTEGGLAHGQGRFEWTNPLGESFVHEGNFENGVIQGHGTRVGHTPDGEHIYTYTGYFYNGLPEDDGFGNLRNIVMLCFALWLIVFVAFLWKIFKRENLKMALGRFVLFSSFLVPVIVAVAPIVFIPGFLEIFRNPLIFVLYLGALGVAIIGGIMYGNHLRFNAISLTKARAFVVSREKDNALIGTVVLETEQGEMITARANMPIFNSLLEGDIGIVHYRKIEDKLDKKLVNSLYKPDKGGNIIEFVKFEREGKSSNPDGTRADERCNSCGAAISFSKFKVGIECEYCSNGNTASDQVTAKNQKNIRTRLGNFLMLISVISVAICLFFLFIIIPLTDDFLHGIRPHLVVSIVVSVVVLTIGAVIWEKALPITQIRVLVKSRSKSGSLLGNIVFETEQGEALTMGVEPEKYNLIFEGDVGILHYKSEKDRKTFYNFEREGKSAALAELDNSRCESCGGAIHMEKYKFSTEIICEYCNSIIM